MFLLTIRKIFLSKRYVPSIGIGTWHMGENKNTISQEIKTIQAGIEMGARVIDTVEMYGSGKSENLVGTAISDYDRKKFFDFQGTATKCFKI